MPDVERVINRKIVRKVLHHYGYKGQKRIDEIFGAEKERGIGPFFGRMFLKIAMHLGMKKLGMSTKMKESFLSGPHNRQTVMNILRTVADNGMQQPFRFDGPALIVWNYTSLCNLRTRCSICPRNVAVQFTDPHHRRNRDGQTTVCEIHSRKVWQEGAFRGAQLCLHTEGPSRRGALRV